MNNKKKTLDVIEGTDKLAQKYSKICLNPKKIIEKLETIIFFKNEEERWGKREAKEEENQQEKDTTSGLTPEYKKKEEEIIRIEEKNKELSGELSKEKEAKIQTLETKLNDFESNEKLSSRVDSAFHSRSSSSDYSSENSGEIINIDELQEENEKFKQENSELLKSLSEKETILNELKEKNEELLNNLDGMIISKESEELDDEKNESNNLRVEKWLLEQENEIKDSLNRQQRFVRDFLETNKTRQNNISLCKKELEERESDKEKEDFSFELKVTKDKLEQTQKSLESLEQYKNFLNDFSKSEEKNIHLFEETKREFLTDRIDELNAQNNELQTKLEILLSFLLGKQSNPSKHNEQIESSSSSENQEKAIAYPIKSESNDSKFKVYFDWFLTSNIDDYFVQTISQFFSKTSHPNQLTDKLGIINDQQTQNEDLDNQLKIWELQEEITEPNTLLKEEGVELEVGNRILKNETSISEEARGQLKNDEQKEAKEKKKVVGDSAQELSGVLKEMEKENEKLLQQNSLLKRAVSAFLITQTARHSNLALKEAQQKIEELQDKLSDKEQKLDENVKNLHQVNEDWQKKAQPIAEMLQRTQTKLMDLVAGQEEKKEAQQSSKEELEVSEIDEKTMGGIIENIQELGNRIEESVISRDEHHNKILNHHREKIEELNDEKEELKKNFDKLRAEREKIDQELAELRREAKENKNREVESINTLLVARREIGSLTKNLEEANSNKTELEQNLEKKTEDFAAQVSSLNEVSEEQKNKLIQKINLINDEKGNRSQEFEKELKSTIDDLKKTTDDEKKGLQNSLNALQEELEAKNAIVASRENLIDEINLKTNKLKEIIETSDFNSNKEKQKVVNVLNIVRQELDERDILIKDLEMKKNILDENVLSLSEEINLSWQINESEKEDLRQELELLKDAKLTSEEELEKKITRLTNLIETLPTELEKETLEQTLVFLQNQLTEGIKERNEEETSTKELNQSVKNLQEEINFSKTASQQERDNLLNQLNDLQSLQESQKNREGEFTQQINVLKGQIEGLSSIGEEKTSLQTKIIDLEQKLVNVIENKNNYKGNVAKLEENLRQKSNELSDYFNSLQNVGAENKSLLEAIGELRESKLNSEELSQELTSKFQAQINDLQISNSEKGKLNEQVRGLEIRLSEKLQTEQNYKNRIKILESNLAISTKNLGKKLNVASRRKVRKDVQVIKLVEKIKSKERDLKGLHNKLASFQTKLDTANTKIEDQKQRIKKKTEKLTVLTKELSSKDEIIDNLQTEITRLKEPPTFMTNGFLNDLGGNIQERKSSSLIYSQEDLENLIKEEQLKIQKLTGLLSEKNKEPQQVEFKEVLQNVPKKNRDDLNLWLLGYSLETIILCLGLLKKLKQNKKK